jgi:hypothetical protein
MPVRVEDVVPNDAFTYEFATRQWADLFKDWEHEVELLATRVSHVLQNPTPSAGGGAETAAPPPRRVVGKPPSRQPLLWGAALLAAVLVVGGVVLYMRPSTLAPPAAAPPAAPTATAAPPRQTAAQTPPPPASAPQPPAAAPALPPEPPPPPQPSAEETAWRNAQSAGTRAALAEYRKAFPAGAHAREAELRIDDMIIAGPNVKSNTFDGTWATTWICPAVGQTLAFSYQFLTQVKDGDVHGQRGNPGEPGSLGFDGKIEPDGTAAMFGKGIVGNSAYAVGGAPVGRVFYFHVTAHFDRNIGSGHRIEDRACNVSFVKQ